jgi:UTP--glucose-1-phosphate uridylyltransferase
MKLPTKAIICAAGMGTRMLPLTKAVPKEMLPIVDKPIIQYIVEQAVQAGVTDIIIVTSGNKRAIEDYFDRDVELENKLRESGKGVIADKIENIASLANFAYVRQKADGYGTAMPTLSAMHLIGDDEPFFVFFPDDYFKSDTPYPTQLLNAHKITGKSVISIVEIAKKDADKYGMVAVGEEVSNRVFRLKDFIERPGEANAPSNLASAGSFLLTPEIMPLVLKKKVGFNGEIMLADSIIELIHSGEVYGCSIEGVWHDTGDQLKYLKAVVDEALTSDQYGKEFEEYLKSRLT